MIEAHLNVVGPSEGHADIDEGDKNMMNATEIADGHYYSDGTCATVHRRAGAGVTTFCISEKVEHRSGKKKRIVNIKVLWYEHYLSLDPFTATYRQSQVTEKGQPGKKKPWTGNADLASVLVSIPSLTSAMKIPANFRTYLAPLYAEQ